MGSPSYPFVTHWWPFSTHSGFSATDRRPKSVLQMLMYPSYQSMTDNS